MSFELGSPFVPVAAIPDVEPVARQDDGHFDFRDGQSALGGSVDVGVFWIIM
jgi:hypothetical protein